MEQVLQKLEMIALLDPITLIRDKSGTVYDADYLGQIKFKGDNDAGQSNVYAKMTAKVLDASDLGEDGLIEYAVKKEWVQIQTLLLQD